MGEGLVILAILESIDKAAALPRQAAVTVAKDAIQRLLSALDSLKRWSDAFYIRFGRAPWFGTLLIEGSEGEWTKLWVPKHYRCKRSDILLDFSGHLLGDRRATYPHIPRSWFDPKSLVRHIKELSPPLEMKQLSTRICQSIKYLMQEDMKLFGPSSILLPLRVALMFSWRAANAQGTCLVQVYPH